MSLESFPVLNIPLQRIKIIKRDNVLKIFDVLRKRYFVLTPEEYVRQQFTLWLRNSLHYPSSLMANEFCIELNGLKRRCDTIIFNKDGSHLMVIEYKAPEVVLTQAVFDQIVRYNLVLKAKFLIVTNGLNHYCCMVDYDHSSYIFLPQVPDYLKIQNL